MQLRSLTTHIAPILLIALALAACGADGGASVPTTAPQSAAPTSASAPTAVPVATTAPTSVEPPTAAPTIAPTPAPAPTDAPTAEASAAGELTDDQVLQAFQSTFATFPRRMRQSVITKEDNKTTTATAEVESADRMHLSQELNGQLLEAVMISPTLYLKLPTGWQQQNDPSLLEAFSAVGNPANFLKRSGFDQLIAANKPIYKQIGTEQIGGVATQIYQYEIHSPTINATYTFWLGADGRMYKMESESERLKSSTMLDFDSGIKVEAPTL